MRTVVAIPAPRSVVNESATILSILTHASSLLLFPAPFARFRKKLKVVVDSNIFPRGILVAILINTLSMGIEYHNQVRVHMVYTYASVENVDLGRLL
jgi:hypothetical protein